MIAFHIVLDNSQGIFYPGQIVGGRVSLMIDEELKTRGVLLKFIGYGQVQWTERHKRGKHYHTVHYHASETYVKVIQPLLESPGGGVSVVLKPGSYTYPFQIQLPLGVPSSYEATIGRVRYVLQATIDRPWAFDTHAKMTINVMQLLDLNTLPNLMNPAEHIDQKTLCCLCCESDPISASIWIDRTGFVPGEAITFRSEINNKSNRVMSCSKAQLMMQVKYHAVKKTRTVNNIVNQMRHGPIEGGGTDIWMNEKMHIPPVPPSFLTGCNIIDIKYYIMMTVDPSGLGFDLNVPLEITIGSIPLAQIAAQYGLILPPMSAPGIPLGLYTDGSMPSNIPQVTFAESVLGRVNTKEDGDTEHTTGNIDFAPMYSYYNWNKPDPSHHFEVQMDEKKI